MRLKKISLSNKPKSYIDLLDCEGILTLLISGFSLEQAMNLLENDFNKYVFNNIKDKLNKGEDINSFFHEFVPKQIKNNFKNFISYLPFNNSLKLSLSIYNEEKLQRKKYISKLLYPSLMLIATIIGIYFFIWICFPILLSLMKEFKADMIYAALIQKLVYIFLNILFVFVMIIELLILYYMQSKNQVKGYKLVSKFKYLEVIKLMISNDFARFYQQCTNIGCSTISSIQILKSFDNKPIISFIAKTIDDSLIEGNSFKNAFDSKYLDKGLFRFLNISLYSLNTDKMLEGYIKLNEIKLNNFFKKLTLLIQGFTYSSISIVLIFVYQVLLLPLSIITNL